MAVDDEVLNRLLDDLRIRIGASILDNLESILGSLSVSGKDFLKEELSDAAWWTVQLAKAPDDAQAAACLDQLETIRDRVVDKILSVAVDVSAESKSATKVIVSVAFDYIVEVLPKVIEILSSLKR